MKNAQNIAFNVIAPESDTEKIRALNDAFHRNIFIAPALGDIIFTAGVGALSDDNRFAPLDEVRCFEDFSLANEPYGEHDFGTIVFKGETYFWKIDYYDHTTHHHSL